MTAERTKIVLGLWPIAGITTVGVTPDDAEATVNAAIESGITVFDTAFSYGFEGESDRLLGKRIGHDRDQFTVMGKVGQRWTAKRERVVDGAYRQLIADAEVSLKRMKLDHFDVLFLHAPDPKIPVEESARAMRDLKDRGLCNRVGFCNATLDQIQAFATVVPCDATQCPLNLVQRDHQPSLIDPVSQLGTEVYVFWTLMKGLLAGKISRDHVFAPGDSRPGYEIFQGESRRRVHDLIDQLSTLAQESERTVAQLSIGWTLSQPGVTAALVGARRPEQVRETAKAAALPPDILTRINQLLIDV